MASNVPHDEDRDKEIDEILDEITAKSEAAGLAKGDAGTTRPLDVPDAPAAPQASEPKPEPERPADEDKRPELDGLPKVEEETPEPAQDAPATPEADEAPTEVVPPVGVIHAEPAQEAPHAADVTGSHMAAPKKRGHGRAIGIAVGAIVAGLAVVYVGGSVYFSSHFMPNTTVNGEDVSGMSETQLANDVTTTGQSYAATVSGDNLSFDVKASDIGLAYDGASYAQSAISQANPWAWPAELLSSKAYTVDEGVSYDQQKLEDLVAKNVDAYDAGASQPTNASIAYNQDSKQFEIKAEQYGTAVDKQSVTKAVEEGVAGLASEIKLDQSHLVQPTVTSDNSALKASLDEANKLTQLTIPLNINGTQASQVTPDMIAGWVTVDGSGNLSVNGDAIKSWTTGDLSEQFDTVGTSRTYTRADGKQVTVSGGTYGWSIDGTTLASSISDAILNDRGDAIDVPMKQSAAVWNPGGADWKAYIDVDLTEQHARYYDDSGNVIWESDFVSGNPTLGNETPTGVYSIDSYMQKGDVELRGLDKNGDGEPDYISHVTYWMPFVDNLVAFHDASWRGSFGGSIYLSDGSHGCVNLPSSAAQTLYGMVNVGTVVVVHA